MSDRLEEIRWRETLATKGPWSRKRPAKNDDDGFASGVVIGGTPGRQTIYADPPGGSYPSSDCDFIAHSREDIPYLLVRLEECERLMSLASSLVPPHYKLEQDIRAYFGKYREEK